MRILQVHKFFYPHAGSETVLFHTRDLLASRGHEVIDFAMQHPSNLDSQQGAFFPPRRDYTDASRSLTSRSRDALASVYSLAARKQLRALLKHTRPDVAHIHLIYHQLTMSVVDELERADVPMVMTLHDYKIGCPAYILYRDGRPCHDCTTGAVHNVVVHRCVKGSRAASVLAGLEAALSHKAGKYQKIDAYICPSRFVGDVAVETGIPEERVRVIPNFLPEASEDDLARPLASAPRFFFAGRLEEVKGVKDMLEAFRIDDPTIGTLVVAGAGGELEAEVRLAAAERSNVLYLGRLSRPEIFDQLRQARAAILPARWDENNPMSILEARTVGVPVVVSERGGLPEMVDDGVDGRIIRAGDIESLRDAIRQLSASRAQAEEFGLAGYRRLCRDNSPQVHYESLMQAYSAAIGRRSNAAR